MAFNTAGAISGAGAGASFGPYGALAGGILGAFGGGGGNARKTANYQAEAYTGIVLPALQRQQQQQAFLNNQGLGTFAGSGNEAQRFLTSLGTGQFGLGEAETGRLGQLQAQRQQLEQQIQDASDPAQRLQAQSMLQELDSLQRGQAQGQSFAGVGSGGFLQDHPLFQAQQSLSSDAINQQYAAAFGGQAPSSFLGKAQGQASNQALLDTFGAIQQPLIAAAGLGGQALGQGVGANTGLASNVIGQTGSGLSSALNTGLQVGAGQDARDQQSLLGGIGGLADAFNPTNVAANQYAQQWLANKTGSLGGVGTGTLNSPNAGQQQPSGFLGGLGRFFS